MIILRYADDTVVGFGPAADAQSPNGKNGSSWLKRVVGGFFNHHAVPTNSGPLVAFRYHVT
jgi:hypothetical protein